MSEGMFLGTKGVFDPNYLKTKNVNSQDFKESIINLYKHLNSVITILNSKTSGKHPLGEFITGDTYYPDTTLTSSTSALEIERPEIVNTINFGALPNTTTKSVAHNIAWTSRTFFTSHIATATDSTAEKSVSIPYASATTADIIEINVDGTNVNITTGKDWSSYDCVVILKYLKF